MRHCEYMTGETPVPPVSEDCNGNGLLDECEIAWHIVADANENGIPDPCEEEYRAITGETPVPHEGGGGGGEGEGGCKSLP